MRKHSPLARPKSPRPPDGRTVELVAAWTESMAEMSRLEDEYLAAEKRAEAAYWEAEARLAAHLVDDLGVPPRDPGEDDHGVVVGDLFLYVTGGMDTDAPDKRRVFYNRVLGRID
jgi:hypothetical protein